MKLSNIFQGWKGPPQEQIYETQRRWLLFWKPRKRKPFYSRRMRVYFWFRRIGVKLGFCKPVTFMWYELPAKVYANPKAIKVVRRD